MATPYYLGTRDSITRAIWRRPLLLVVGLSALFLVLVAVEPTVGMGLVLPFFSLLLVVFCLAIPVLILVDTFLTQSSGRGVFEAIWYGLVRAFVWCAVSLVGLALSGALLYVLGWLLEWSGRV